MLNGEKNTLCRTFSLYNHYPKCKEVVCPFLTVGFEQLLVMVKRIQQTSPVVSPFSCFLEAVCLQYVVLLGRIPVCVWSAVWALVREIGEIRLAPGLKYLLDLLSWLPPGTQPIASCWFLRILHLLYNLLIKRSAEVGASAADFSWTPRKLFREMLDIKFWCYDMKS